MSERDWEAMNEKDFDDMLAKSVSFLPPDDVVEGVTPWRRATNRVLVGMALCTVTLNFLCLDYILPAIGTVLALLGFRALRRENKWFGCCFAITIIRAAIFFPSLILNTTIIRSAFYASDAASVLTAAGLLLLLVGYVCLWRGFRAVQRKAGLPEKAGAAAALIVWFLLVCVLAAVEYSGWIIIIAMLVAYIFIIRNLFKLSKVIDEAGYSIQAAPVKVTDKFIVLLIVSVLIIGCAAGYIFGGSYPMDWSRVEQTENTEAVKTRLKELGFPEYALNDLTPEDIAACDGAIRVVVDVTNEPVNDGRTVNREYEVADGIHRTEQETVYDVEELRITGIGVQIDGERDKWIIFHHFLWTVDPGFYGTEAIRLMPTYQGLTEGWVSAGEASGRVLYDKDGETFAAPYHSIGSQTYTSDSVFWGKKEISNIFAEFSMPRHGENYRGYVAYPVEEVQDGYIINSWIDYTHQKSFLQYPAMTAAERQMSGFPSDSAAFVTIQDALQFNPTKDGVEMLS